MYAIIDFILLIFNNIVRILSIKPFPDFKVSYIQLICCVFVISALLKLCFLGFKEVDRFGNSSVNNLSKTSKNISNEKRKEQLVDSYKPKHAKK